MRIATQNVLLVAPIFLLLALTTSLLLFFVERREVEWGLDSGAQGLALAIAEFTSADAVTKAASPTAVPADIAAVRDPIDRILKFGQATRVEVFDATSGTPLRVLDVGERSGTPPSVPSETLRLVLEGRTVSHTVPGANDLLSAYAAVRGSDGRPRAIVSVETSLASLRAHEEGVVLKVVPISLLLLLVGCAVSLVISRIISGEIGRLTATAQAFAAGDYDARLEPGPIEEVAVVGSTFGIMGSVLKDATLRSTREMLQLERFNTDAELSERYAERFAGPIAGERGGVRFAVDRLGRAMHGDFWFIRSHETAHYACLGRIEDATSFQAMIAASAAATFVHDAVAGGMPAQAVLLEAAALCGLHCCALLQWADGDPRVDLHRLWPDGRVERSGFELPAGGTRALTTLDQEPDRKARQYVETYSFATPAGCVEELQRFIGDGTRGGVLVLQAVSGAGAHAGPVH